ncbi:bifunctional helix-turn-helix transcriptional regulator/GNAT family N-acetyltransferase [Streptomyces sp. SLBN-31]|jgi:DNA-binding MarR family transcriptional regulator/ribosomal protein S18 acetylase RimI-like enzyme|uniref:bifunctional helix-turn-helix transcriptional regulator/GNAT family N-acetyltransferase n=1 Tax=Streptomyces sp. SLBN-31 TaxID=2768444 RepID=UPI00115060ED|nr:bifunctional helix-turn-helix transcriptional regulator/GNAT family N-acetyltransferase [Streptomyces sp. SLBN-31]TQJ89491.1 MarR family transcriptional regulator with acetyltransferase activity [Streptomyces sp. SLBN-31]
MEPGRTEPVPSEQVAALRRFNRYFTRRIGALDDHYLGQDRPLGEARLLFEIAGTPGGVSLRELRSRLGLDAGYLSRMTKALQAEGMVRISVDPRDNRLRTIEPTDAGRLEVKEQNRRANALAAGLLDRLTPAQRDRLVDAMTTAQRLLRLAAITVELVDGASPDARACLDAYAADIDARFPEGFDKSDLVRPEQVSGAAGAFFVAYEEGRAVGCGALRTLESGVGEIKHVWVHPDARRLGLAGRILEALEGEAAARGHTVVRLDTHASLTEAQAMYRAAGYREIPAYLDHVYASHWFEKRLRPV